MATQQLAERKTEVGGGRAIGPIGTTARVATGLWLFSSVGWAAARGDLQIHEVLLGLVGLPMIVMLVVVASQRVLGTSAYLRANGPVGTLINLSMIVALFAIPWTTEIAYFFYGVPVFLAAWRGYPGCEMLAISNLVLQRKDELGCPWFYPVDAFEERFTDWSRPEEC